MVCCRNNWTDCYETRFKPDEWNYVYIAYLGWVILDRYVIINQRKEKEMSIYVVYAAASVFSTIVMAFIYFSIKDD